MTVQWSPWLLPPMIVGVVAMFFYWLIARGKVVPGVTGLRLFAAFISVWAVGSCLDLMLADPAGKSVAAALRSASIIGTGCTWFLFALEFSRRQMQLSVALTVVLLAIPVATFALGLTNPLHGLVYVDISMHYDPDANLIWRSDNLGPVLTFLKLFTYLMCMAGSSILVFVLTLSRPNYKAVISVVGAPAAVIVANMIERSGLINAPYIDLTLSAEILVVALLYFGVYRQRLLNTMPVVRDRIVHELHDPMIVVDAQRDIVDVNPAAAKLLDASPETLMYTSIDRVIPSWPSDELTKTSRAQREVIFAGHTLEVSFSGLDKQTRTSDIVLLFRDITEQLAHEQQLIEMREASRKLADTDGLTGLANRRVFEKALFDANARADASTGVFALCLLDLDQFKVVNDTCGHAAGDQLLLKVAQLLLDAVRPDDLVARLGGDEFALILYGCRSEQAAQVAEKIRRAVENLVFIWDSAVFRIGASIGVLVVSEPADDPSELLRVADAACYTAKDGGRNQAVMVSEYDLEIAARRSQMHWVQRLHEALEKNTFVLFVQDIHALNSTAERQRCEILIRMRDAQTGNIIPPGAFLPAAEEFDLSTKLDEWVVRRTIHLLHEYPELLVDRQAFWINLSGRSIGDARFQSVLEKMVRESKLPAGTINFEITETAVIQRMQEATRAMERLKGYGCRFALDDFGSGLSSFAYLKKLPVDYVKIDGMFIRDIVTNPVNQIFVKSMIDIARVMGIGSIAEFVEDDATRDLVAELGVDYGQGFGLARPVQLLLDAPGQSLTRSA